MAGSAEGDAREDQLLANRTGNSLRNLRIVEGVDRGAIDDRNAGRRLHEFRKGRTPHAVACGSSDDDRQFEGFGRFVVSSAARRKAREQSCTTPMSDTDGSAASDG